MEAKKAVKNIVPDESPILAEAADDFLPIEDPVSYTHLAVYKRQGLHCTIFWGISKVVNVLKANKRQKLRPLLVEACLITGGTWQIRTAVHGFADR